MFVSGYEYAELAKWSFCPRYPVRFSPKEFQPGDLVFVNLDYFPQFLDTLRKQPPANRVRVITQNSDKSFTDQHMEALEPYVTKVYAINATVQLSNTRYSGKLCKIPIGFRDHKSSSHESIMNVAEMMLPKIYWAYMNFAIHTNKNERTACHATFRGKLWVKESSGLPLTDFYYEMSQSKYVISPPGEGIDCHRIYEAIFFNSIPILKRSQMDDFYRTLPVLIVEKWSDVNATFLENVYADYYEALVRWKSQNQDWYKAAHWIR
jgi:hypothetical protein